MRKIFFIYSLITFVFFKGASQGSQSCPTISAGSNSTICGASTCQNLSATIANIPKNTNTYLVNSIPYNPYGTTGTATLVNVDDQYSNPITIGFKFCYFGNTFTQLSIGCNGQITFTPPNGNPFYNPWPITTNLPNTNDLLGNTICAVFRDIDTRLAGVTINYRLEGTAPCRRFIVSWNNVPLFNTNCYPAYPKSTIQCVLYETSNIIDVFVANSASCPNWNSGRGIIGIQNANGTVAFCPPGRNMGTWTITNEAWSFVPNGTPLASTIKWFRSGTQIGTGANITVCPGATTTYRANLSFTACGGTPVSLNSNVTVTVGNPIADAGPNTTLQLCTPDGNDSYNSKLIVGTGPPVPGSTYLWSSPASCSMTNFSCINCAQPTIGHPYSPLNCSMNPITYILTVTHNGCTATDILSISYIYDWGKFDLSYSAGPNKTSGCPGAQVQLTGTCGSGQTPSWYPLVYSGGNTCSPIVAPASNTNYVLYITRPGLFGNQCMTSSMTSVTVGSSACRTRPIYNTKGNNGNALPTTFHLYPNPSNDGLFFLEYSIEDTQQAEIDIFDITGKLVSTHTLSGGENNTATLNESKLATGIYYYQVIMNGNLIKANKISILK